ncbi:Scr1 family TA system antitoxin-like transcriptional regulator [Nocardiopsis synnemataformans]|uniref:Scr1 family TA system antitoxin-like transcriptional regulator n=1 Tax=Nocardiopsis synnemataformans TaxID=61305 RepID=UPI003EBCD680
MLHVSNHGLTAVYTEGRTSSFFLTGQEDVEEYGALFNRLRAFALSEGQPTRRLLEHRDIR